MDRIKVAILGATGAVGQRFVTMLTEHPWFEIHELVASERSAGRLYKDAVHWLDAVPLPSRVGEMVVKDVRQPLASRYLFSGLDAAVAGDLEQRYADLGHIVISNAKNHRMRSDVPLVVPEVNANHLDGIIAQLRNAKAPGAIITNPNCVVAILVLALAPIQRLCGIDSTILTSLQAISGAGYPGVAAWDIVGNVLPYIAQEETKVEGEVAKILGDYHFDHGFEPANLRVSASCYRVPVLQGHSLSVSVKTTQKVDEQQIIEAWRGGLASWSELPTSPLHPICYLEQADRPQPVMDVGRGNGMTVSIGRLRRCSVLDWKFSVLGHNTIRGAAGGALLNAEYLVWRLLTSEAGLRTK